MHFYTGSMFPPQYRKQLFIAEHGSWNRTAQAEPYGYRSCWLVQGSKVTATNRSPKAGCRR